jgi:hypothetical protein
MLSHVVHKVTTEFEIGKKFAVFCDVICGGNPCLSFLLRSIISTVTHLGSREAWVKFGLLAYLCRIARTEKKYRNSLKFCCVPSLLFHCIEKDNF